MRPATLPSVPAIVLLAALGAACRNGEQRPADTLAGGAPAPTAAPTPGDSLPAAWRVTEHGLGPLRAGMSVEEAARALGGALTAPASAAVCGYAEWHGGPPGVRIMTEGGRVARVEVAGGTVATDAGARIGDSAARVRELYAGRVAVTPHKYVAGAQYLTVTPASPADSAFRIVFETDSTGRVTRYRAGRRPQVEYVEGCG
jgi:hypothetical protein